MTVGETKRTRLTAAERREQLLDAATSCVLEKGFHEVSIDGIARKAGITRAVVYQHFDDLPALLSAVIDRATARAQQQVETTTLQSLDGGDARALMLESVRSYITVVSADPDTWRLVLMQPEGAPEELRRKIAHGRTQMLAAMTSAVLPILEDAEDAELTARVLSAIADQYARLALEDPDRYPPGRLLDHADWMIAGFLSKPA
jgi:AcrR family transcriptional regulator